MEFKTAAEENAGTDANVYFQMIGEEGESQEIELKNKGNGYFNRGQLDRFRIRAKDVGRVSEKRSNDPECPFFQFLPKEKNMRYKLRNTSISVPRIYTDRFKNVFINRIIFRYDM